MNIEKVKKLNIAKSSGCYQFLDKDGKILYIGKAANLKSRVSSYFLKGTSHSSAKYSMLKKVDKINLIETESEIEALLLESNLIKKHQPPYNVMMRDDKRYQYIKITTDDLPRIATTRNIDRSGRYFGPFTSGIAVRETLKAIGKIFPYGKFATMPNNKINETKIKRYPEIYQAPEDAQEYKKIIKQITKFLEGDMKSIERNLKLEVGNLEKSMSLKQSRDRFVVARNDTKKPLSLRGAEATWQSHEDTKNKIFALKYRLLNMKNVLAHSNVLSIYDKYASDVVELAKTIGLKRVPKRIEGYDISNIFGKDAVGSMVVFKNGEIDKSQYRKFKIKYTTPNPSLKQGGEQNILPYRVGSMVVFKNGEIDKSQYRKFKIKYTTPSPSLYTTPSPSLYTTPNPSLKQGGEQNILPYGGGGDTAMLREILERRFKNDWPHPDLIIIDGGKGQLNASLKVLKKFKLTIAIIAISKGEGLRSAKAPDKIFFPGEKEALKLPLASPVLHIIKRVRDEAHRFAITFHRNKRSKNKFKA